MTLQEYLMNNTLITNTYGIFDYNTLKARLIARWGKRKILDGNIADIAQNALDVEREYYEGLFNQTISPLKTWSETTSENSSENGSNNQTNSSLSTTEHTGTVGRENTSTAENKGSNQNSGTNSNTNTHNVWAYNSSDKLPENSDENSGTQSASGEYNENNESSSNETETLNTKDETNNSGSVNGTSEKSGSRNIERYGYNLSDSLQIINTRFAAYDILINDIVPLIIDFYDYHL